MKHIGDEFVVSFGITSVQSNNEIVECINELRFRSPGIVDIAVVSVEGLPIASLILDTVDETRFAAMTAATLSLGDRVVAELRRGRLKKVLIEGDQGYIITLQAGDNAVLTISATPDAKLGLLFLDLQRAAERIAKILT